MGKVVVSVMLGQILHREEITMTKIEELAQAIAYESANWHREGSPVRLLAQILASLPGGEALEDAGIDTPYNFGWREIALLAEWLTSIEGASDVQTLARAILEPDQFMD